MLKVFRAHTKKIVWVIVIALVLWGIGSSLISKKGSTGAIGTVNGKKVSATDFNRTYKIIFFSMKVQSLLQNNEEVSKDMLFDSVFQHMALLKESQKQGIKVTDEEVQEELMRRFSPGGQFSPSLYERWVKNVTGQSLRQYEEGVREEVLVSKYIRSIRENIKASDEEIADYFYRENRKVKAEYITTSVADFKDKVAYTNDDLVSYYQKHIAQFKTEQKFQFRYILFTPQSYLDTVTVSDNEMVRYFDQNKEQFTESTTDTPPSFDSVKESIKTMLQEQKAEQEAQTQATEFKASITDVAQLATMANTRGYTLKSSGMIPFSEVVETVGWGRDVQKIFTTIQYDSLELCKTAKGYVLLHITNVVPAETIDFQTSKDKVISLLIKEKSLFLADKHIMAVKETLATGTLSLADAATQFNCAHAETSFFTSRDSNVIDKKSTQSAFNALWKKQVGEIVGPVSLSDDTLALFKVTDIWNPTSEEFETAKDAIEKKIVEFKQYFEVQQTLSEVIQKAQIKKFYSADQVL